MTRIAGYFALLGDEPEPGLLDRMARSFNLPGSSSIAYREDGFGLVLVDGAAPRERLRQQLVTTDAAVIAMDGRRAGPEAAEWWLYDPAGFFGSLRGEVVAGARFDRGRRMLSFFRDRFGARTFYYATVSGVFLFASEIKPLLASGAASFTLDRGMLGRYLSMNYRMWFGREQTFFEEVRELPIASYATVDSEGPRVHRYWAPPDAVLPDAVDDRTYVALYRDGLERAVGEALEHSSRRLFLVSGGLDAPVIAAEAARLLGEPIDCCAAVFPGDEGLDESRYVRGLTEAIGGRVILHDIGPDEFLAVFSAMLERHDQPLISPTYVLFYRLLSLACEEGYDAVFGGGGGDIISHGCLEYQPYLLADYARYGERAYEREIEAWCRRVGPFLRYWPGEPGPLKTLIGRLVDFDRAGVIRNNPDWVVVDRSPFGEALADVEVREPPIGVRYATYRQSRLAEEIFHQAIAGHFVEDLNGATFPLAGLDPFWDLDLVELGFQLPLRMLLRDGWTKFVVREAVRGVLPELLRCRAEKTGLGLPFGRWFRSGPLNAAFHDILRSRAFRDSGLLDVGYVEQAFERHVGGAEHGDLLWRAFAFCRWAERWLS